MENPNGNPDKDVDMLMDDNDEDDDDVDDRNKDGWEVDDEWLMALVTPPSMHVVPPPSTFEVGEPFTAAPGLPFLVGRPLPEVVSSVAVHHEEIKGDIRPRVTTLDGQVGVLASQQEQVDGLRKDVDGLLGLKGRVQTLESTVQEIRKENQKLRDLLSARESDQSVLALYMLGLGEGLAMVEL
uniref:Uncharacterized protein n=1 Tax=Tanacetum cinerariifolium TaxID=118510 RepID=A0A699KWE5_TANCI|nr:hypothetical protein [Tanacetum cinerariifolium]